MALRIRYLKVRLATESGPFGVEMRFTDGLNILSAPNTSGKSTCAMSILYALGLEGMLGPSQNPPLPDAMLRRVMDGDRERIVTESRVWLEIENHRKESLTVDRLVTGTTQQRQLIRGTLGPALTAPSDTYPRRDFYVRTAGGMQAESGFHRYLATFLGYDLPNVPGAEKEPVPLYLECLFPYFFVDQLTGWRDIKSRMPSYLRIPEMTKRSAEYVLDLDILRRAIEKQDLLNKQESVKKQWAVARERADIELGKSQAVTRGIPEAPTAIWPSSSPPQVYATDGKEWKPLKDVLERLKAREQVLTTEAIPQAEAVAQTTAEELRRAEEELDSTTEHLTEMTKELMAERANLEAVYKRLRALLEDDRKYKDAKRLRDRGGELPLESVAGVCPTCHQPIKDVLLHQEKALSPMTLEENLAFIKDQIDTFATMRSDLSEVIAAKEHQAEAIVMSITELNARIRALRKTLHSDGRVPSYAAVQERLQIEGRLLALGGAGEAFEKINETFKMLAKEWSAIEGRLKVLADISLSDTDKKKLSALQESFIAQLREYKFTSFPLDKLEISAESYRPSREGYDVGLTSASDTIRMIWAYLLGMLEVARDSKTNHIGLMVFDEPRQQGADAMSFDALLKRAAEAAEFGQQVICTTSEDPLLLDSLLAGTECNQIRFNNKILRPIKAPPSARDEEEVIDFGDDSNDPIEF